MYKKQSQATSSTESKAGIINLLRLMSSTSIHILSLRPPTEDPALYIYLPLQMHPLSGPLRQTGQTHSPLDNPPYPGLYCTGKQHSSSPSLSADGR